MRCVVEVTDVVALGLEHSVANMSLIPFGWLVQDFAAPEFWAQAGLDPAGRDAIGAGGFLVILQDELRCDPRQPVQTRQFFGSSTTLRPESVGVDELAAILARLGLEATSNAFADSIRSEFR